MIDLTMVSLSKSVVRVGLPKRLYSVVRPTFKTSCDFRFRYTSIHPCMRLINLLRSKRAGTTFVHPSLEQSPRLDAP